ncbi:MAG TPA: two-component system response regulator, partial [Oceanicaulis sp.]|nr:two-component system response regulator [Oceanicaulis sp.]
MTEHTELDLPEDKTLLLVDDDEPFRNRLSRAMESRGFDVISAVGTVAEAMGIA